jgi:hypothetical protein
MLSNLQKVVTGRNLGRDEAALGSKISGSLERHKRN